MNNETRTWSEQWMEDNMRWPDTTLVRMLKGNWPECNLNKEKYSDQRILDVGCGDASNFPLYKQCGFKEICGVEISDEICEIDNARIRKMGISGSVRKGTNNTIPFKDDYFDYIVSWNALYYMGWNESYCNLEEYIAEFSRCLKSGGVFIFSIPNNTNGIYRECEQIEDGYVVIRNDRHNIRNGFVFYRFEDKDDIEKKLSCYFGGFHFGSVEMSFFGDEKEFDHTIGWCINCK